MKRVLLAVMVFLLAAPAHAAWWSTMFRVIPKPWIVDR